MGECFCKCVILRGHKDWYCEGLWSTFGVMNVRAKTCGAVRDTV
jgi:hypothetical protein